MNEINPAFLLLIPVAWCLISLSMSRMSGWSRLAREFPCGDAPEVTGDLEIARMRTGRVGVINYYSCLTFKATEQGLYVSVAPFLRLGHKPFYIPWNQFHHIAEHDLLYSQRVKMSVGKPTINRFLFPGWVKYHLPYEMRPDVD